MPMILMRSFLYAFCLTALLAVGTTAVAAQADRDKPIQIEADAMRYDDVQQVSVFTGNVVITKGSIQIRAATVRVHQAPDGYQYATAIAAPGKLAHFQEQIDTAPGQPEQQLEGQAQRISYDGKTGAVTFSGQAILSRLIGGKLTDRSQGSEIVYNQITDVFTVQGGSEGVSPSNPNGRVRVMLSPQQPASAPVPAASGARLQVAPALGGQK